ncbi:MAG: hypothetical protein IKB03_02485 [Tidjanibacter sp.]|nr:hypothetical protein [Tidjanibacter sp.]
MITIQAKKHDNFSVEFKFGFEGTPETKSDEFVVNTWIFVPNSLDINPQTYGKDQFYRDIKSNVRLITPVYLLRELSDRESLPFVSLRRSFERLASMPTVENIENYESQIKMFAAIFKSALRNHSVHTSRSQNPADVVYLTDDFVAEVRRIVAEYRSLYQIINVPTVTDKVRNFFLFGDEFMSHIIDVQSVRILKQIDRLDSPMLAEVRATLVELMRSEKSYKRGKGYEIVEPGDEASNRALVFRYGLLKKYIESDLYIRLNKKRDGFAIEQIYYSLAAGLAMIFATAVAWFAQLKYGNITGPLFIVLVVSYMLKDRIKDLMRYYFAHRLGNKYHDNKAEVRIHDSKVGLLKEGVDFISEHKTPAEVMDIRGRSSLVEAENKIFEEKILLYRKRVVIDNERLADASVYPVRGVNEILRLHLHRFTQKMDNAEVPVDMLDAEGRVTAVNVQKIYYINMVMQLVDGEDVSYRRFRVVMTRDGILSVEDMK